MPAFDKEATLTQQQWRGSSEQKGTKHRVSWMKRLKQRIHFRRECDQRCKKEPWSHISNSRSDDKDTVTFLLFRTKKKKKVQCQSRQIAYDRKKQQFSA